MNLEALKQEIEAEIERQQTRLSAVETLLGAEGKVIPKNEGKRGRKKDPSSKRQRIEDALKRMNGTPFTLSQVAKEAGLTGKSGKDYTRVILGQHKQAGKLVRANPGTNPALYSNAH